MSAVEAGRLGATVTMEEVRLSPGYQADLAAARAELATKRAAAEPLPPSCAAEMALVDPSVLAGLRK
jgi:acid phosphatase (class A)